MLNIQKAPLFERILPFMLTNYSYASGLGLMHGKMGGVLFFFMYARYIENKIYEEYAEMLMEDIYNEMHENLLVNFETGLCGIGWCIEYMIRNKLIDGNTDDILKNIDEKIMSRDPLRINDFSMKTGLGGILLYVNARIKSYERDMPFDQKYLKELEEKVSTLVVEDNLFKETIEEFKKIRTGNINYDYSLDLPDFLFGELPNEIDKISDYPLGIHSGLTGIVLKSIVG